MRHWQTWVGIFVLVSVCGCGGAVLLPVFASAQASTRMVKELKGVKRFTLFLQTYAEAHQGRLPGRDWLTQAIATDPSLQRVLHNKEDNWDVGIAAVPGTLNRKLEDMSPETILFVGYRTLQPTDVLEDLSDVGDNHRDGVAIALTAQRVMGSRSDLSIYSSTGRIGYQLAKQGAPGLK